MAIADLELAGDATLVLGVARYRDDALAELFRRHAGAVHGLARRVLWDERLAEDVVQEVFVRLWAHPDRYDPDRGSLRAFLLAQAHGRAVDLLRAEGSRRAREEREARLQAEAPYDLEHAVADLGAADSVRAALDALPPGERQVIELAYFAGHSYREVASLLGQPEGTVKGRIRNGLKHLHALLVPSGLVNAAGEGE